MRKQGSGIQDIANLGIKQIDISSSSSEHERSQNSPTRQGERGMDYDHSKEGEYKIEPQVTEPNPSIIGPDHTVLIPVPVDAVLLHYRLQQQVFQLCDRFHRS
jgi:hypothetical protein